jgi:hypothetical protein
MGGVELTKINTVKQGPRRIADTIMYYMSGQLVH